jgi:ribosomal protein L40E
MLYKVEEPKLFVMEFFGNRGASTSSDVENYIRGFINERIINEFGSHDIFTVVKNVDSTTDKVTLKIGDEAARIGLKVIDCVFEGVKIPEEARRFASGMGSQAMVMQYMKETATELKGSEGGGAAAAGLGAGMGLTMPYMMAQQMQQTQQGQQVVICQSCGAKNPVGTKFCGTCGASLVPAAKIVCPKCKAENPAGTKFCGNCGSPLTQQPAPTGTEITCSKCGTKNPEGTKFCGNCGEKLG